MERKTFISTVLGMVPLVSLISACGNDHKIAGTVLDGSASKGHLLRDGFNFPVPGQTEEFEVVVIGAGVSGLSAARQLKKANVESVLILELEDQIGGNASYGKNELSAYPWGAHYVPIPNQGLPEYQEFLEDVGVITGFSDEGLPFYNEEYLCFAPQERLYINGTWQEGLVPRYGLNQKSLDLVKRFLEEMKSFRYAKGSDGKDAFAIPVSRSSLDKQFIDLDSLTMENWMRSRGFNDAYLDRYVNYCCRDDYGTDFRKLSAWTGIHYFASRKGLSANAHYSDLLTWPEGNGFLVNKLLEAGNAVVRTNSLVYKIEKDQEGKTEIEYYNPSTRESSKIICKDLVMAIPQFVAGRLLNDQKRLEIVNREFQYGPWMVANLRVDGLAQRSGAPASWDNVIHESQSLGYVEATHSQLKQHSIQRNFTYYLPLTEDSPSAERKKAASRTHEDWINIIVKDLQLVHPGIRNNILECNIKVWGHAMAQPVPGHIHGEALRKLSLLETEGIYHAHSDLSGISIFEEAFYQGIGAANKIIQSRNSKA